MEVEVFCTDFIYTDRQTKAKYTWLKYRSLLHGRILDVGADECYLKSYLEDTASYWGIGLGGNPDQRVDLEREDIPFPDRTFDCVLALDVLEHLDDIHRAFDELCRVTRRCVIICLPNCWASFWSVLRCRDYRPNQPTKFYGLPLEKPKDRHKWFFSIEEAERFVAYRAAKNGMRVMQADTYGMNKGGWWERLARRILVRSDINPKNLYAGALWVALEKKG